MVQTDFASITFGKAFDFLDYKSIAEYFQTEQNESNNLEFKMVPNNCSVDDLIKIIGTTIAAYLNSEGGILILGAPKGQNVSGRKEKIFIGQLTPTNILLEKDWLINKISGLISPMPVGIKVKILTNDKSHIYIFKVMPSEYKPHQYEGKYFIRLDGQNKPAPHYLVEALIKQIRYPDLKGVIKFNNKAKLERDRIILDISIAIFNFSPVQNDERISVRMLLSGAKFINAISDLKTEYSQGGHMMSMPNYTDVLHYGMPKQTKKQIEIIPEENELIIVLTFGGKHSPAKYSSYKLNLNNFTLSNVKSQISEVNENILFNNKTGKSPEQILEEYKNGHL